MDTIRPDYEKICSEETLSKVIDDGYELSLRQLLVEYGIHTAVPVCHRVLSLTDHRRMKEQGSISIEVRSNVEKQSFSIDQ